MVIFHSKGVVCPFYILLSYILQMNMKHALHISSVSYQKHFLAHSLFMVLLLSESHLIFINNLNWETLYIGLIFVFRINLSFMGLFGFFCCLVSDISMVLFWHMLGFILINKGSLWPYLLEFRWFFLNSRGTVNRGIGNMNFLNPLPLCLML